MAYLENFRNTFFVDILEGLGLVKIPSNFKPQAPRRSSRSEATSDIGDKDIEQVKSEDNEITVANSKDDESDITTQVDPFLVDWNGPDDPENPQNWKTWKKTIATIQVMLLTCATYMGSSIYTPGQEEIQQEFGVGHVTATLNLSVYVFAYGLGPMLFSPLSEEVTVGRNHIYIYTLFLFVVLQIPAALAPNIGGLIVVRFLTGFLSSPSLATGGATLGDFITMNYLPQFIGLWAVGAVAAPALAPLLGGAMVAAKDWRYTFWFLMIISGFTLIIMIFFFTETLHANILHRRAQRVRKETGDDRYYTIGELQDKEKTWGEFLRSSLYRPIAIIVTEPGVLAIDFYIALVYGAFYLFFEAFPIVFIGIYNFTVVELGAAFLGFCVGCVIAYMVLIAYMITIVKPRFMDGSFLPEHFLILAMWVCWLLPLSLFLFGWTASVHWILPIISEIFFVTGVFNLFQCAFGYLARSYPRYIASVFAGNALVRSAFASAFPLFGKAMYDALAIDGYPVAWGSSLIGFSTIAMAAIPFVLYKYGAQLRGKSKYAN